MTNEENNSLREELVDAYIKMERLAKENESMKDNWMNTVGNMETVILKLQNDLRVTVRALEWAHPINPKHESVFCLACNALRQVKANETLSSS